jgi:hypothetical protein
VGPKGSSPRIILTAFTIFAMVLDCKERTKIQYKAKGDHIKAMAERGSNSKRAP